MPPMTFGNVVTPETAAEQYKFAFNRFLDSVAQERRYDDRVSICSYLGSSNSTWAAEAQAYVTWRDGVALPALLAKEEELAGGIPTDFDVDEFLQSIARPDWPE